MTMKAWRLDRLGGHLRLENVPMPEVRPGSVLVHVEASTLMSYIKPYVEGRLPPYHAPSGGFTPGGNCVGTIETAGKDVWQLAPGQRVLVSSFPLARERSRPRANSHRRDLVRSRQREGAGGLAGWNAR
jgi:alcohol dehydrogenase